MAELIQYYNAVPAVDALSQERRDIANELAKHLDDLAELKSQCSGDICEVLWKPSKPLQRTANID